MANDYTYEPCYSKDLCDLMRRINAMEDVYPVTFTRMAIYDGDAWLYSPAYGRVARYDLATWTLQDFFSFDDTPYSSYGFGDIGVTDAGVFVTRTQTIYGYYGYSTTLYSFSHIGEYRWHKIISGPRDLGGIDSTYGISTYGETLNYQSRVHTSSFSFTDYNVGISTDTGNVIWQKMITGNRIFTSLPRISCQDDDGIYIIVNDRLGFSHIDFIDRNTGELLSSGPSQDTYNWLLAEIISDGSYLYICSKSTEDNRSVQTIDRDTLRVVANGPIIDDSSSLTLQGATATTLYGIRNISEELALEYIADIDKTTFDIIATRYVEEEITGQTRWFGYGPKTITVLSPPDSGVSKPGNNELVSNGIAISARPIDDLRQAIRKIARRFVNVDTGQPFNFTTGNPNNLYLKAMGDRTKYGATGGAKYTWTRSVSTMEKNDRAIYDLDIGEIYECVVLLESSAEVV